MTNRRRKQPVCGPCSLCGALAYYRCARCERFRCFGGEAWLNLREHATLRKVRGQVGVFRLCCTPECRQRMTSEAAAIARVPKARRQREQVGKAAPLPWALSGIPL